MEASLPRRLAKASLRRAISWDELRVKMQEAVEAFYFESPKPARLRMHMVRDEVLAIA
jgi:hypothetical protein